MFSLRLLQLRFISPHWWWLKMLNLSCSPALHNNQGRPRFETVRSVLSSINTQTHCSSTRSAQVLSLPNVATKNIYSYAYQRFYTRPTGIKIWWTLSATAIAFAITTSLDHISMKICPRWIYALPVAVLIALNTASNISLVMSRKLAKFFTQYSMSVKSFIELEIYGQSMHRKQTASLKSLTTERAAELTKALSDKLRFLFVCCWTCKRSPLKSLRSN